MNVSAQLDRAPRRTTPGNLDSRGRRVSTHNLTKAALRAEGLPRRRAVNRLMELVAWLAAALAIGILVVMVWSVARRGAGALTST